MNKIVQPQWLEWAKELQFIAQGGLTYSKDVFDIERFERIREIAAEMLSLQSFHNVLGQTSSAGKYECPVKVENFLAVTLSSNWQCQYGKNTILSRIIH